VVGYNNIQISGWNITGQQRERKWASVVLEKEEEYHAPVVEAVSIYRCPRKDSITLCFFRYVL
jgi:hypothetical protein